MSKIVINIPVRITSRNQQRANRKKPLQKHKKNVSIRNDNSQWPNRKVSIPHYNRNKNNNFNEQVFRLVPSSRLEKLASPVCDIGLSNGNNGNAGNDGILNKLYNIHRRQRCPHNLATPPRK